MLRISLVTAISFLTLLSLASGQTDTVYNNFGSDHGGWGYLDNFGWSIAGPSVKPPQYGIEQAIGFSPKKSGVVSDIWVAIFYMPGDPGYDEVTLKLTRNTDGLPPKTDDVMEEWTITDFPPSGTWEEPQHLVGSGTAFIEKGKSYWLWAIGGEDTWCGWSMNVRWSLTCPHTMKREGEDWTPIYDDTAAAFRVDVRLDYGLAVDSNNLSESTGGIVTFNLAAGKANAGRSYILCGGLSGTLPGMTLPGGFAVLPINWDVFSTSLLYLINTPPFQDFEGDLSHKNGSAQAILNTFGPLPPGAIGLTLYFAYALNDPWDYASNPVMIDIVP